MLLLRGVTAGPAAVHNWLLAFNLDWAVTRVSRASCWLAGLLPLGIWICMDA